MLMDSRFYTLDGKKFYPSVTTIISDGCPKPAQLVSWWKQLGLYADRVAQEAANKGKIIHNAISDLIIGKELKANTFRFDEWEHICRFAEFCHSHNPRFIHTELQQINPELGIAGTLDMLCYINDELWLIDVKTGSGVYETHYVQLGAYKKMWDSDHPERPVDRIGVLHTDATTRGADKKGKSMQGKKWKVCEPEMSAENLWDYFCDIKRLWDRLNPEYEARIISLPDTLKL
ncbi:hypothetical protein GCM10009415_49790 [Chitinophaga japonensis]